MRPLAMFLYVGLWDCGILCAHVCVLLCDGWMRLWTSLYHYSNVKSEDKINSHLGGLAATPTFGARLGVGLAPLGDLDQDGYLDLAMGAEGGSWFRGEVYMFGGKCHHCWTRLATAFPGVLSFVNHAVIILCSVVSILHTPCCRTCLWMTLLHTQLVVLVLCLHAARLVLSLY